MKSNFLKPIRSVVLKVAKHSSPTFPLIKIRKKIVRAEYHQVILKHLVGFYIIFYCYALWSSLYEK